MRAERWKQIDEIFQSALDTEPESRSAYLDSACGDDLHLRAEIESLLASHENSDLTSAAFDDGMKLLEHRASQLREDSRIGPYRVLREIGYGGMGSVYLAARADDAYRKLVAIKIIRRGLDTDDIIQRFRSERQILASLEHPNITRLLDAGSTDDGLPYFVMEYIDGEPIDQYCDTRKLNTTERLKLFQSVCAAVHYAHQNLVIHRDIKPGNVLVTKGGTPRLLDFGVAKLLTQGASDTTVTVVRRLTPEYASPEQVRGDTITTASDVYSLGVLLYRLLTGHSPYRVSARSATGMERAVCDEEPERPSAVIPRRASQATRDTAAAMAPVPALALPKDLGDFAQSGNPEVQMMPSDTREGTPDKLRRRIEGDLDNIILKALRKEPQRRYASAEQLSEDITRHLSNLPVIARPDTRGYRTAKFVQRHLAGVVAAAIVFLSLTGGIATALWQAHIAKQQRDRAHLEQAKADRIKSFMTDMLTYSSPEYTSSNPTRNPEAKVSEVVDQAAKRAEAELADQPEVLADVQTTIGGVYVAQGRYDQAESILRAAREKAIRLNGAHSHQAAEVSGKLADALLAKGNYKEADALFRQDIEIERRLAGEGRGNDKDLAHALAAYGAMLDQRQDRTAEGYLREALKYSAGIAGKERVFVAMLYNDLSNEAGYRGDVEEEERCLRASLDEYRKLPPGTYVETAVTLSNLGGLLIAKRKYTEAEPFVSEGLELRRKVLGNAHTGTAGALYRLSDLRYRQGRYIDAEEASQESIEVFKRALSTPQDSVLFTNPLLEMGFILDKVGRNKEAEAYLRQALDIRRRLLPAGNLGIVKAEGALGECLTSQKRYADAEPLLLGSYQILQSTTVPNDSRRTEAAQRLYDLYSRWGNIQKAAFYKPINVSSTK